jgi:dephospho-CoA kinase
VVESIAARWPDAIEQGAVSRARLARVFDEPDELQALEAITHPVIKSTIDGWLTVTPPPTVLEVSVPKVIDPDWGTVVVVTAPAAVRVARAVARGMEYEDALRRLESQPSEDELLEMADVVIDNSEDLPRLLAAVDQLDAWCQRP